MHNSLALASSVPAGTFESPSASPGTSAVTRAAAAGDPDAFNELYHRYVGRIFALSLRLTASTAEAEELTQDAFVRAWEKLGSFRFESELSTWLHRLTVNVFLTGRRAEARRHRRVEPTGDLERVPQQARSPDPGVAMDLEWAIGCLPDGARLSFVLHDVEGYSHAEIGEALGIAAGTSRAQLFRARRLLRDLLEQ